MVGRFDIHPSKIYVWKKVLAKGAAGIFGDDHSQKREASEALTTQCIIRIAF